LVEDTALKTAARKGRGFDSLSLRFGPVAQRQEQLPYKQTVGGSSPPGTTGEREKDEGGRGKAEEYTVLLFHLPPSPFHLSSALVVQPGVDACLSRRRSWVQIPSRALTARYANRQSGEAQTFATLWVRLPPLPLDNETCSPRLAVNQLSRNKRGGDEEVRFLHVSLVVKSSMPRWSIGRTSGSQPDKAGSIPARGAHGRVVELVDT
jgi:hypothetical protein